MDNFNIIYKILKQLEKAMDYDEFDMYFVSAEHLKISENRWVRIWEMLAKEGYVDGVNIKYGAQGDIVISISTPRITLKGIEYLHENSFMKKAGNLAKGIIEVIPKG
ncbi:MAG: YjcQ family protein [Anaerotignaceae bacterium]